MSETRSRSRSPARDADAPADSAPPADDYQGGAPADNHGDGGEEVKLYVGNLDYGTFVLLYYILEKLYSMIYSYILFLRN